MRQAFERAFAIGEGVVDMDSGEFSVLLATEGEAYDGHRINLGPGFEPARSIPMLFEHRSTEAIPSLGTMTNPKVTGSEGGERVLHRLGKFADLDADSPQGIIRRDFALLMNEGALPSASLRWHGEAVWRRSLERSHWAHAEDGLFFRAPVELEGSLCAVGVDPKAASGRADSSDACEASRAFWRSVAEAPRDALGMVRLRSHVVDFGGDSAPVDNMGEVLKAVQESNALLGRVVEGLEAAATAHEEQIERDEAATAHSDNSDESEAADTARAEKLAAMIVRGMVAAANESIEAQTFKMLGKRGVR